MAKKYIPSPEELRTILELYSQTKTYAAVSRETGLSAAVVKRIIEENSTAASNGSFITYNGIPPVEPAVAPSKAMFYYKLMVLMKEILHV